MKCPFCESKMKIGGIEAATSKNSFGGTEVYWYSRRTTFKRIDEELILSPYSPIIGGGPNQVLAFKCDNCHAVLFRFGFEWNKSADHKHDPEQEQFVPEDVRLENAVKKAKKLRKSDSS